ncbi:hypothetical protein Scep_010315 [Stephania cephalantha]|uniref:Uncharacterized protein n=1 Tax=Stephania cephalantha TaxID=152367 RepID=A0AAP0PF34_9MAGN
MTSCRSADESGGAAAELQCSSRGESATQRTTARGDAEAEGGGSTATQDAGEETAAVTAGTCAARLRQWYGDAASYDPSLLGVAATL